MMDDTSQLLSTRVAQVKIQTKARVYNHNDGSIKSAIRGRDLFRLKPGKDPSPRGYYHRPT